MEYSYDIKSMTGMARGQFCGGFEIFFVPAKILSIPVVIRIKL